MAKYTIPFKGLKDGNHEFDYTIDQEFFEQFQTDDVYQGTAQVKVNLEKGSLVSTIRFELDGKFRTVCDRCLDELEVEVSGENSLYIKFGEENEELADDVMVISDSESEIRLAHYMYELFTLSLPLSFVHPEDEEGNSTCNDKMLEKLDEFSVNEEEQIDPRWNDLKKLFDK